MKWCETEKTTCPWKSIFTPPFDWFRSWLSDRRKAFCSDGSHATRCVRSRLLGAAGLCTGPYRVHRLYTRYYWTVPVPSTPLPHLRWWQADVRGSSCFSKRYTPTAIGRLSIGSPRLVSGEYNVGCSWARYIWFGFHYTLTCSNWPVTTAVYRSAVSSSNRRMSSVTLAFCSTPISAKSCFFHLRRLRWLRGLRRPQH